MSALTIGRESGHIKVHELANPVLGQGVQQRLMAYKLVLDQQVQLSILSTANEDKWLARVLQLNQLAAEPLLIKNLVR